MGAQAPGGAGASARFNRVSDPELPPVRPFLVNGQEVATLQQARALSIAVVEGEVPPRPWTAFVSRADVDAAELHRALMSIEPALVGGERSALQARSAILARLEQHFPHLRDAGKPKGGKSRGVV